MARAKTREAHKCAYPWCEQEATCAGLCVRHYNWEYYHRRRGHGLAYFSKRAGELEELGDRCKVQAAATQKARKRKLRVVK